MKGRRYEQRRRAENREETHRRIVEATVALHESLGPRATTISAIAKRAGVQRLTVYRHFPDDEVLFHACSSSWMERHPFPDAAIWASIPHWRSRCRAAFGALFSYYRRNQGMLGSVFRDADLPAMREPMRRFDVQLERLADDLIAAAGPELADNLAFGGTVRHALSFAAWQQLAKEFDDTAMVDLVMHWLEGIVANAQE